jgi:hypothetical protein
MTTSVLNQQDRAAAGDEGVSVADNAYIVQPFLKAGLLGEGENEGDRIF